MADLIAEYPRKVKGHLCWAYQTKHAVDQTSVRQSSLRSSKEISLELEWDGGVYQLTLQSDDGLTFHGSFEGRYAEELSSGTVSATLYSNNQHHALIGKWVEDETPCFWWAELREVEQVDDEA